MIQLDSIQILNSIFLNLISNSFVIKSKKLLQNPRIKFDFLNFALID